MVNSNNLKAKYFLFNLGEDPGLLCSPSRRSVRGDEDLHQGQGRKPAHPHQASQIHQVAAHHGTYIRW